MAYGSLIEEPTLFYLPINRSISFYTICVRASHKLHNAMFKGIISTSLRFFDTNPSGRILNLFSKDLGTVDESLPKSLLDASQSILIMTGSISLTLIVRPYFIIPIILIGTVFIFVRKIYLNSSKDIKRMEGISKLLAIQNPFLSNKTLKHCSTVSGLYPSYSDHARIANYSGYESTKCPCRGIR